MSGQPYSGGFMNRDERAAAIVVRPAPEPAAPAAVRSEAPPLDPALDPEEALRRIGRACLTHYLRNRPAALAGCAEGVHQMRVALRRLDAALAVLGKVLPAADRRRLAAELGRLNEALAPVRDLDVLIGELLPPVQSAGLGIPDLEPLAAAALRARQRAQHRLAEMLRSPRHEAAMRLLAQSFEGRAPCRGSPAERTLGALLPALLDRRLRAVRKRGKGFRRQTPKARHRLRIAVKMLRYALELFGGGAPAREEARAFLKELRRLQDGLGYASDIRTARRLIDALSLAAGPGHPLARAGAALLAWHRRAFARREPELRRAVRRLTRAARFWQEPARP
jgi:triphosphatase